MAYQMNVINAVEVFFEEISPLITEHNIHAYLERKEENSLAITSIADTTNLSAIIDDSYYALYLTTEKFDPEKHENIYDDNFCQYAIEVLGGRSTATELENISLRIISKTPDKKVNAFFNKLGKMLNNSSDYGMGDAIKNKTLWFDFKRKMEPLTPL
jgi:hypothetical protein